MEVITIETSAFSVLLTQIEALIEETRSLNKGLSIERSKYLTATEVGAITGYSSKSIKNRKDEIGYITQGGELKFIRSDVDSWMRRYYISPTC